ncbi:MAG: preprotein translocase subunit YajC [Actinomycetota bacterium]|nr:preprotein translocase subunit YajC [Actinomycetota bacterium]
MWALLSRPQQRRVREHLALVATVGPGDEVITTGGIVGTILSAVDDIITLEVAPGVSIRVLRSAIQTRIAAFPEDAVAEDDDGLFDEDQFEADALGADDLGTDDLGTDELGADDDYTTITPPPTPEPTAGPAAAGPTEYLPPPAPPASPPVAPNEEKA